MEGEDEYDLVVVGGGVYGLPVAKTYLEVNPTARILLLDGGQSIGGTWSAERIYEGLQTNNLVGSLEYADFPMDFNTYGVPKGSHIPGVVLNQYLNDYVDHYGFRDRIRLGATVQSAEMMENGSWLIRHTWKKTARQDAADVALVAKKLVLATGTTSEPCMPSIPGSDAFGAPMFHSIEFAARTKEMSKAKNIAVLGGARSAVDTAYLNASRGRHVDWIIRESGRGPAIITAPRVSPAKLLLEGVLTTRCFSFLSPTLDLDSHPIIRKFFHNTRMGRAIARGIFGAFQSTIVSESKYADHQETNKLTPRSNFSWWGTTLSIFDHPTGIFGLIQQGRVHVHIADVASLSHHTVHLANGTTLPADALICCTGYEHTPTVSIQPASLAAQVGMSASPPHDPTVKAADAEILRRFPVLADQPRVGHTALQQRERAAYTLHRGTVPPACLAARNFAYIGQAAFAKPFLNAPIQALWITAFLDGRLSARLPGPEEAEWEALLQKRFWRWRAPNGFGARSPDMMLEMLPFLDTLLRDLGLKTRRKKGGWWREWFESYGPAEYEGLVAEWLATQKGDGPVRGVLDSYQRTGASSRSCTFLGL